MTLTSLGDLSAHFLLRRQNTALRSDAQRLAQELTTGERADPVRALGSDLGALADIDWRRGLSSAFGQATREAAVTTGAMQQVLGKLQDAAGALGAVALLAANSTPEATLAGPAAQARETLSSIVSALNTRVAGRSVFAGVATDRPALASTDSLLADLRVAVAGLTDPAAVAAAIRGWFDTPGGGFEMQGYQGAPTNIPAFRVAEGERVSLDIRADSPDLRAVLSSVAMAALANDPGLSLGDAGRRALFRAAGMGILSANDGLTGLRAALGVTEKRLEETGVRLQSEQSALEQARATLLGVDPYEAATRLEQARMNLESLYTVTARLSRLRLTEYL